MVSSSSLYSTSMSFLNSITMSLLRATSHDSSIPRAHRRIRFHSIEFLGNSPQALENDEYMMMFGKISPQRQKLITGATDLLNETSRTPINVSLLSEKASILRRELSLIGKYPGVLHAKDARQLKRKAKQIHDYCLLILSDLLPDNIINNLKRIGTLLKDDALKKRFEVLREGYPGCYLDLPYLEDRLKPTMTLQEFFFNSDINQIPISNQVELIENGNLSDFHKKNLISSIVLNKKFNTYTKLRLTKAAFEKGADISRFLDHPKFIKELALFIRNSYGEFLNYLFRILETACLNGCKFEKGATSLLKELKNLWDGDPSAQSRIHIDYVEYRFLELAIDFGGDPLDAIDQRTIDIIQQCIAGTYRSDEGKTLQDLDPRLIAGFGGYSFPNTICVWQFKLVHRANLKIYQAAERFVKPPFEEHIHAVLRQDDAAAGAAAGGNWPRELSGIVCEYVNCLQQIAMQVQQQRVHLIEREKVIGYRAAMAEVANANATPFRASAAAAADGNVLANRRAAVSEPDGGAAAGASAGT